MEIYRDYTTSDVLFDEPYVGKTFKLYPIKVKQFKKFMEYANYFLFSKKHYGIDNKHSLLEYTITVNMARIQQAHNMKIEEIECMKEAITEFSNALSIVCREIIFIDKEKLVEGEMEFINADRTIIVNKGNYELIRKIILKQNLINEPKIFEDEIEEKLAQKYLNAQRKNNKGISGMGEIANLVSCCTGKSYEQLYNQNVMQLYTDYYRCINTENFKTTSLFRTVSDKVDIVNFTQEVTSALFQDPYAGMWKDRSQIFG